MNHFPKRTLTLQNGRTATKDFDDSFSKSLTVRVMTSPAYLHLAPTARAVCNLMYVKNDNAKHHKRKAENGKPVFTFTVAEAMSLLKTSNKSFANALEQLDKHGLIERHKRGGLLGANGIASEFTLSTRWRDWKTTGHHKGHANIQKARATARKKPAMPG